MPDLSGHATTYRAGNYRYSGYLAVFPRQTVFSRAINQASFTYPITSLTYDNPYSGTGVYTSVAVGQSILVYDGNTSVLKGILRVAYGAASSTVLQVNEVSEGTIVFADNDRLDVVYEFGIHDMLRSATTLFKPDSRITYSDQNANPPPVCNSGGSFVGSVDRTTGYYSHDFDGTDSFTVDPDSAGTLTHAWTFPGGTPSTSSLASPTGILFPASESAYLCTHTVTDTGNSKTQTQYITGRVYSDTIRPFSVAMTSLDGTVEQGDWTAVFEVPIGAQASVDAIPDGCYVVYFEIENRNGVKTTVIKFAGYIDAESVTIAEGDSTVEFTAIGPLSLLAKTGALPQILTNTASPANWLQMKSLTLWRMLWYCLDYGSTAMLSHDFIWPDGTDKAYYSLTIENQDSIAGQLKDLSASLQVKVTANRLGQIILKRELAYLTEAQRAERTTSYDLERVDVLEAGLDRQHRRQVKTVIGEGLVAGATLAAMKAVYSLAPGTAPGPGTGTETLSRCVADDQDEMNLWTGEHLAKLNGTYWDETTDAIRIVPQGAKLKLPPQYDVFDFADLEPVTYTLPASANKRGLAFGNTERWVIDGISLSYDPESGDKDVELTVSHETHGSPGVTDIRPSQTNPTNPPSDDVTTPGGDTYTPPAITGSIWLPGASVIALFTTNGILWRTSNFNTPASAGGPTWTSFSYAVGGVTFRSFVVDASSPRYVTGSGAVNGWLRTDSRIYRITDIFGTTPTLTLQLSTGISAQNWGIDFSYGAGGAGLWGVSVCRNGNKTQAEYTLDGASWSAQADITANSNTGVNRDTGLFLSAHTGIAYASGINGSGDSDIYKIDYSGLTWSSHLAVGSLASIGAIVLPFFNNDADTYLYYSRRTSSSTSTGEQLMRYDGSTQTDISPIIAGTHYAPLINETQSQSSRWKLTMPSNSDNKLLMIAQSANGTGPSAVFATDSAKAATPTWYTVLAPGTSDYTFGAIADDGQSAYFWGSAGTNVPVVGYHGNIFDGTAPDNRLGNIVNCNPIGICGG